MLGIIIASHGEFADGILQSSRMIIGDQENLAAVKLMLGEDPELLRDKLLTAIDSFDQTKEVLFLVDLWGGTPFNQASRLIEERGEDSWAIVAGLNLPILIEAIASRLSINSAYEMASHLLKVGRAGIKVQPSHISSLGRSSELAGDPPLKRAAPIPEGPVIGDGKIKIVLARIDSRLLHGQVATGWTKAVKPDRIIVVSDAVAHDEMRKKLIEQAAPPGVYANVVPIDKMIEVSKDPRFANTRALLLFENPQDALRVIEGGLAIDRLNIGSMAYSSGKVVVSNVLSMGQEDIKTFEALKDRGLQFDVRKVPADGPANFDHILARAEAALKDG